MMEQKKTRRPIEYLKSHQMRQRYECGICYQVCIKPVRCRGSCKRVYCMKCASDAKSKNDKCPFKCSEPFMVQRLQDIMLDFYCPYKPQECKIPILSLKEFESHYHTCQFVPQEQLLRQRYRLEYKCLEGHQLEFFIGSYHQMCQSRCQQCGLERLCRSICRICDQLYCVQCRIPPCSKSECPIGHKYNFQKIANLNYTCDICGASTSISNDGVYDDTECNFGICQECYAKLPQNINPSMPRGLIANINTQCSCGQTLKQINSIHKLNTCALCLKDKQCPKQCPTCKKYFCFRCKSMDIQNDGTCGRHEHQLIKLNLKKFPQDIQIQNQMGCMRCAKKVDEYFFDRKCFVRLCCQCFKYHVETTSDKKRCIVTKCDKNHVLTYVSGSNDYYSQCQGCQQNKIIKLQCYICQVQKDGKLYNKSYCFQCKPIKLDTCYFKHKLKLASFQGSRQCQFCCKEFSQFYYCRKCFFYVCKDCMSLNQHKFSEQMDIQQEAHPTEEKAKHKLTMEEQLSSIKIQ